MDRGEARLAGRMAANRLRIKGRLTRARASATTPALLPDRRTTIHHASAITAGRPSSAAARRGSWAFRRTLGYHLHFSTLEHDRILSSMILRALRDPLILCGYSEHHPPNGGILSFLGERPHFFGSPVPARRCPAQIGIVRNALPCHGQLLPIHPIITSDSGDGKR